MWRVLPLVVAALLLPSSAAMEVEVAQQFLEEYTMKMGCMAYSRMECLDCVRNGTTCEDASDPQDDRCAGRIMMCLSCAWDEEKGMCMAKGSSGGPMKMTMQMSFYQSVEATFLFEDWRTKKLVPYVFSLVAVFVVSTAVTMAQGYLEGGRPHNSFALRFVLYFIVKAGLFGVMLLAMTYNALVYAAVILGLTCGWAYWDYPRFVAARRNDPLPDPENKPQTPLLGVQAPVPQHDAEEETPQKRVQCCM